ncbi:Uridine kinase [Aphelenchoides bicaudatus]|nr:Uridine kinase [Aphelenchoides bicaudatus]
MSKNKLIIGVAGGTASGKTSVCVKIMEQLTRNSFEAKKRVCMISQDSFYLDLNEADKEKAARGEFNFDHPNAFDHQLLFNVIKKLTAGESVQLPKYDFCTNARVPNDFTHIKSADVVLVEGILIFFDKSLRDLFDIKLFVDADPDIRLARRVERDTKERGRNLQQVIHQYLGLVKPAFEEFCLPTKKYADVIIPRGVDNDVAIQLIVKHIEDILRTPRTSPEKDTENIPIDANPSAESKIRQMMRPH